MISSIAYPWECTSCNTFSEVSGTQSRYGLPKQECNQEADLDISNSSHFFEILIVYLLNKNLSIDLILELSKNSVIIVFLWFSQHQLEKLSNTALIVSLRELLFLSDTTMQQSSAYKYTLPKEIYSRSLWKNKKKIKALKRYPTASPY